MDFAEPRSRRSRFAALLGLSVSFAALLAASQPAPERLRPFVVGRESQADFVLEGLEKVWQTPRSFSVPQSVVHDEARHCLYVSNFGAHSPGQAEGRQSISKVGLDGSIQALDWVTGLRNPAGLFVAGDRLWAVERGGLAEIDIPGARVLNRVPLAGAGMPKDVAAAADGALYVADSERSAIYKIVAGKAEVWLSGPEIGHPSGIAVDGHLLIVGTNADGCVKSVDLATKAVGTVARMGAGTIDGIQVLPMRRYLVSHSEGRLFLVRAFTPLEGTAAKILDQSATGRSIADFAYVRNGARSLLVLPAFTDGRLTAYSAPMPLFMSHQTEADVEMNSRQRDAVGKIDRGLDTVGIEPGMTVGEVGAGEGYLVWKLASRVGPGGRVLAEDVFPMPLEILRSKAGERGLRNIETILGKFDDPLLPQGTLDFVFMHATIKFVKDPVALFRNIAPSLKARGRIIVIEHERGQSDLFGRRLPENEFRSREEYLKLFEAAGLQAERIDGTTLPNMTLFCLSAR